MKNVLASPQASTELPVEQLYNAAVADYIKAHGQLAELPQDKNDKLPSLDNSLRALGVERDNDMSMFVLGGVGKTGLDAVSSAFGMAANAPLMIGSDILATAVSSGLDSRTQRNDTKPTFSRARKSSVFSAPAKKTAPVAPKAAAPRKFATSMLMNASRMAPKGAEKKRAELKSTLAKRAEEITMLRIFKESGYKFARRMNTIDENGQSVSMLVPSESRPSVVLTPSNKKANMANFTPARNQYGMGMAA